MLDMFPYEFEGHTHNLMALDMYNGLYVYLRN